MFSILRIIISAPIFFIIIPYTLYKVGEEGLSIWALVSIVASYQIVVEMGLTTALVRYVAKEKMSGNFVLINEYLATSVMVYLILGLLMVVLIVAFHDFIIVSIFNISSNIIISGYLLIICAISSLVNLISGLFKSLIEGVQRMDVSNTLLILQSILSALGTYILLEMGFGLLGLGINLALISILSLILNYIFSKRVLPEYQFHIKFAKISRFKEMFSYSANLQVASLIRFWIEPLNKVIISHVFVISYVFIYETAVRFANQVQSFIISAGFPILPAATEIEQDSGLEKVKKLRIISTKYILFVSTIMCSIIIFVIPTFTILWIGSDMKLVGLLIQIFIVGTFFISVTLAPYIILNALGYSKDTRIIQIHSAAANCVGILIFTYLWGFIGFCLGYTLSFIYGFFITNYYYAKRFQNDNKLYKSFLQKKYIIFLVLLIGIEFLLLNLVSLDTYFNIILYSLVIIIISTILIWKLKVIDKEELVLLLGKNFLTRKLS